MRTVGNTLAWTDQRVELLVTLWADGLSAAEIAKQLGGVSRNAVIGIVHRRGLPKRMGASSPTAAAKAGAARRISTPRSLKIAGRGTVFVQAEAPPPRAVVPFRDEPPGLRDVMSVRAFECRWPIGDPGDDGFTLCGQSAAGPYCAHHKAFAYQPLKPNQPRSGNELARALRRYV